jgi:hypothetical protein
MITFASGRAATTAEASRLPALSGSCQTKTCGISAKYLVAHSPLNDEEPGTPRHGISWYINVARSVSPSIRTQKFLALMSGRFQRP